MALMGFDPAVENARIRLFQQLQPDDGAAIDWGSNERTVRSTYFNRLRASRAPSTMVFSFALATGSDSGTSPQSGAA